MSYFAWVLYFWILLGLIFISSWLTMAIWLSRMTELRPLSIRRGGSVEGFEVDYPTEALLPAVGEWVRVCCTLRGQSNCLLPFRVKHVETELLGVGSLSGPTRSPKIFVAVDGKIYEGITLI